MSGGGGNVLKVAAPLALGLMLPGIGSAIGAGLTSAGMGATTAGYAGSALAGAGIGGLGAALTGGNIGKGALLGGIGGGISQGLGANFPDTFGPMDVMKDPSAAAAPIQGLGQISSSNLGSVADQAFMNNITQNVAAPASATSGISGLVNSKLAIPLAGGALSLLGSGKQKQQQISRNDSPAHNVLATKRNSQNVDPSVYYGVGGDREYFDQQNPDVVFAAEGGSITAPRQKGQAIEGQPPSRTSRQSVEGISALAPVLAAANTNVMPTEIPALQRQFQNVDPSVYYGVGGMRDYFTPPSEQAVSAVPMPKLAKGGRLIQGAGDGTSDDIPAMLSDGEYVIPSAVVSALGNGSNKAGAKKLDGFKKSVLKKHYKFAKAPKSMGIGSYMRGMAA